MPPPPVNPQAPNRGSTVYCTAVAPENPKEIQFFVQIKLELPDLPPFEEKKSSKNESSEPFSQSRVKSLCFHLSKGVKLWAKMFTFIGSTLTICASIHIPCVISKALLVDQLTLGLTSHEAIGVVMGVAAPGVCICVGGAMLLIIAKQLKEIAEWLEDPERITVRSDHIISSFNFAKSAINSFWKIPPQIQLP